MTIKTYYESMTDLELDRLSAIEIMGYEYSETPPVSGTKQRGKLEAGKEFASYSWPVNPEGSIAERFLCHSMPAKDWKPTDPNSNQCERYIAMKILDKSGRITIDTYLSGMYFLIAIFENGYNWKQLLAEFNCFSDDPNSINRTKVITYLMAFDKLNE